MNALTICQPYAELVMLGEKLVENRVWVTPYRGPLVIHAGKSRHFLESYQPLPVRMDFGAAIGVCMLAACFPVEAIRRKRVPAEFRDLADHKHLEGPSCWVLRNVLRFQQPIELRGQQGIFDCPDELVMQAFHEMIAAGQISREAAGPWFPEQR